jgi:hypothetical protein
LFAIRRAAGAVAGLSFALVASCSTNVAGEAAPSVDEAELCSYMGPMVGVSEVFAPCSEGERFARTMRQLGFPDNTTYMPSVAADTCQRKAAGLPLLSWSHSAGDAELHRAFREAEVEARCRRPPWTTSSAPAPRNGAGALGWEDHAMTDDDTRRAARRAIDDPARLAQAARMVRIALARQVQLTRREPAPRRPSERAAS